MNDFELSTPVVFIIFNRPDTTKKVFDEIRKAKPKKLFIIADGPRLDKVGEIEKCQQCRQIVEKVDWKCEVKKNFSDVNMGCKVRVSSGLDWVFELVEEAIILEDDCLPHSSFFRFCQELLEKYKYDNRIMMISGDNFQAGWKRNEDSYYFSKLVHVWGWATWRRSWQYYDVHMTQWPEFKKENWIFDIFEKKYANYLSDIFQQTYKGKIDTWDYQFLFASLLQNGLNVIPNVNLISNIGFGNGATHTSNEEDINANLSIEPLQFPIKHPCFMIQNRKADLGVMKSDSLLDNFKKMLRKCLCN